MIKLSVAIICFNEEKRIQKTLESVSHVADEIIVVDSFSTDKTEKICNKYNVKFIKNPFKGHIEQKNFALAQCSCDYVLSLDADEVLSEPLVESILRIKEKWDGDGYYLSRMTQYVDQWIRYSGWYPDRKLRLVKKEYARWGGENPHDFLELRSNGKTSLLKGDLLHYSYTSISSHVEQTNKFTSIAARAAFNRGVQSGMFKVISRPFLKFIRDYFFKRGFLDGKYGFIICYINALYAFLKYAKIRELQLGREID
jgi:glycosyltransferase involved in cell wall biosynthesis